MKKRQQVVHSQPPVAMSDYTLLAISGGNPALAVEAALFAVGEDDGEEFTQDAPINDIFGSTMPRSNMSLDF